MNSDDKLLNDPARDGDVSGFVISPSENSARGEVEEIDEKSDKIKIEIKSFPRKTGNESRAKLFSSSTS